MLGYCKESAYILTNQETQMVGNDCDRSLFATLVGCQILVDNFVLALIRKT